MPRPILFIHGAFSTKDVWAGFIKYFESKDFAPICIDLFPEYRVKANPSADLSILCLKDYFEACVKRVREIQKQYGEEPVIIGHSMGGLLAQKLAEANIGAAAVFLTPAAPADCAIINYKTGFTMLNILLQNNPQKAYKPWIFGTKWGILNCVPKEGHAAMIDSMVFESGQVLNDIAFAQKDPHRTAIIDESQIGIPMLTIGSVLDRTCTIESVRKIGQKYARVGGDYKEYPQNGHMIQLEPNSEKIANDIIAWIEKL